MRKALLLCTLMLLCSKLFAGGDRPGEAGDNAGRRAQLREERKEEEEAVHAHLQQFLDNQPSFGIYHDNYFITGVPTNRSINKYTADAKFQISIRQILFRSILPRNTILALTYSQKSFWDIYRDSFPFADNNYNPGLVGSRPVTRNGKLLGIGMIGFEHESNGRDSVFSRSWNYFVLSYTHFLDPHWSMQAKIWPGWAGSDNRDIYDYRGYGLLAVNYCGHSERLRLSAVVSPHNRFRAFNTQLEASVKINRKANQYAFLQWWQGYGESLMQYNQYTSMIRVGLCIKPSIANQF